MSSAATLLRQLALLGLLLLASAACSGAREERLATCRSTRDCAEDERCVNGACEARVVDRSITVRAAGIARGAPVQVEVTVAGEGDCEPGTCSVEPGQAVTFVAPDEPGYRFVEWSGDEPCEGGERELVLRDVSADTECLAQYVRRVRVRGEVEGNAGDVLARSESAEGLCEGALCELDSGAKLTLEAPLLEGQRFSGWSGAGCGEAETLRLALVAGASDLTCTAHYVPGVSVVGVAEGAEAAVIASSTVASARCEGGSCQLDVGSPATLEAPPVVGSRFVGWSGSPGCASDAPTLELAQVHTDLRCTAHYLPRFQVRGAAQGALPTPQLEASSPDTFARCAEQGCEVDRGGSASLLAPSVAGYRLRGWLGPDCADQTGPVASFADVAHDLSCTADYVRGVAVSGATLGAKAAIRASSTSPGADCLAATCTLDQGGTVQLSAPSVPGYSFGGWSGDPGCAATTPAITLTAVTSSKTCVANYARLRHVVMGSALPELAGMVLSSSSGATAQCKAGSCTVDHGDPVTLVASPLDGYRFVAWSGCSSASSATLTLPQVQAAQRCEARFERQRFTVTALAGAGGSVALETPSAGGGSCMGASCVVDYDGQVTLRARASAGYRFVGWSGCAVSAGAELALSGIRRNSSCSAAFVERVSVAGAVLPAGSGGVAASSTADGAVCAGATCALDAGGAVRLVAEANTGFDFVRWSGCSTSTRAVLDRAAVAADESCTANFARRILTVTVTVSGTLFERHQVRYGDDLELEPPPVPPSADFFEGWTTCEDATPDTLALTLAQVTTNLTCNARYGRVR